MKYGQVIHIDAEVNKMSIVGKSNYELWSTSRRDEAEEPIITEMEGQKQRVVESKNNVKSLPQHDRF